MPSLYQTILLLLGLFPLCRLQFRTTNSNLNPRFVQWMNGLFYLPPEGDLRVRKEYRTLTDQERNDFHRAVVMLKRDRVSITFKFAKINQKTEIISRRKGMKYK